MKTIPDLSIYSTLHQDAIKARAAHFHLSSRNVIDKFKELSDEEIKQELKKTAFPFAVCFENWIGDFNIATGIRNADAFNAKEVFYLGDKKIDRRGTVGVMNRREVQFLFTMDKFLALRDRYTIVGIDNVSGSVPLSSYQWKPNTLMVFGSEGVGLTPAMIMLCQELVHIEQFGSVRSLNCGTASGIVMFDYTNRI